MTDDAPFPSPGLPPGPASDDTGATIIRPSPGGRRGAGVTSPAPAAPMMSGGLLETWSPHAPSSERSHNPVIACANGLLTVAAQVRGTSAHPDPDGLREGLIRQVREFEAGARARGLTDTVVLPARYVLCSLLDESVLDTPWGSQSIWSSRGLLISFHNETWGGEKFFAALERLLSYPAGNLHLLELMYLCLALGFEGRYRVREGGRDQLNRVREQLFQTIRAQRGDPEQELSPHWRGTGEQREPLLRQLPLWVFSAVSALLLLALFTYFTFALNRRSDPVFLSLGTLDQRLPALTASPRPALAPSPSPAPPDTPDTPAPLTLRLLLANDIAAQRLEVVDRPQGQTIIVRGDDLFASGSVTVKPPYIPLLQRIAEALAQLPGAILVTGHTDSAPIKSLRFPSNWHLSQERANRVRDLLIEMTGNPARFNAEGRADVDPLIPDNPRDARNRRVEVMLMTPTRRAGESASITGTNR